VVQEYTAAGVVVEVEDHSGNGDNVTWYQQMATMFKGNPLVFLETPNEPSANNLAQIQIGLVNAIRGAGFTNPIALQPAGGFDFSNISGVTSAVGTTNLFVTPHIFYGLPDPNGPAQYVANDISTSQSLGLFPVIDEFGDAIDGFTRDPVGDKVISSVIAANEAGKAGALFWAMDNGNHPDGADSAFLNPSGSQLTPVGQNLQPWLSQPTTATGGSSTPPPVTPPATPSPDGTKITTAAASPIIDQTGNRWTLVQSASNGMQIAVNGTVDMTTANVVLLETLGGNLVQENTSGNWYSEPGSGSAWAQITAPTPATVAPAPPAPITTGSGSDTGPVSFPISDGAAASVGGETFVLTSGSAATVTLGTGASRIKFIGAGSLTLVGSSGQAVVTVDAGNNQFIAGTGTLDVTGGSGKDAYVFHANSGLLTLEDFSIAKGDTLTIDEVLKGSLQQSSDGQGGTMLTFGAGAAHGVDIHGIGAVPTTSILWA
jgi:hypothetical protein